MASNLTKAEFIAELRAGTKNFSLMAIDVFRSLPDSEEGRIIGKQFLRSSLSVGFNYRAVCRSRSKAEFYSKLCITIEEADQTLFWLEILMDSKIVHKNKTSKFENEGQEIMSILSTARKNTK